MKRTKRSVKSVASRTIALAKVAAGWRRDLRPTANTYVHIYIFNRSAHSARPFLVPSASSMSGWLLACLFACWAACWSFGLVTSDINMSRLMVLRHLGGLEGVHGGSREWAFLSPPGDPLGGPWGFPGGPWEVPWEVPRRHWGIPGPNPLNSLRTAALFVRWA